MNAPAHGEDFKRARFLRTVVQERFILALLIAYLCCMAGFLYYMWSSAQRLSHDAVSAGVATIAAT
ncbi:MAG: hypothetical protein HC853_16825, partial [Anaerolineae bacterium]|nr:hypothetical protein [Anaerolineae bacterium]